MPAGRRVRESWIRASGGLSGRSARHFRWARVWAIPPTAKVFARYYTSQHVVVIPGFAPTPLVFRSPLVICPFCSHNDDRVIDSRPAESGRTIRRRRVCNRCDRRFTTYERVEQQARLVVVKRDGSRVPFDPDNILRGIQAACGKRPVPEAAKVSLAEAVEEELHQTYEREVESSVVGELVMARLREVDEVAYIRFASEYHQFMSATELQKELDMLKTRPKAVKDQRALFEDGKTAGASERP